MTATAQGKKVALEALARRRAINKDREPIDNSRGYAGSPMYFDCVACGTPISHPESYTVRQRLCGECQALKALGWLDE